jgi:hypothetical protein
VDLQRFEVLISEGDQGDIRNYDVNEKHSEGDSALFMACRSTYLQDHAKTSHRPHGPSVGCLNMLLQVHAERRLRRLRREKYFLFARRRHDCSWVFQRKNSSVGHCNGRSKAFGDQALTSAQHDSIKLGKLPIVRHKASKVPLYSMNPSWFHLILAPVPARLVESGNYNLTLEAPDSEDLAQRMIRDSAGFRYNGNHYHGRKQSMAPQSSHTKALRP